LAGIAFAIFMLNVFGGLGNPYMDVGDEWDVKVVIG
jgi:hypothetical protein